MVDMDPSAFRMLTIVVGTSVQHQFIHEFLNELSFREIGRDEERRKITLKEGEKALKMHLFGL